MENNENKNNLFPKLLQDSKIYVICDQFIYELIIIYSDGETQQIRLNRNEPENWLNTIIDYQLQVSPRCYDMLLNNWDNIANFMNEVILWEKEEKTLPKYKKGDKIKILHHATLEGREDIIEDIQRFAFGAYLYTLEKNSKTTSVLGAMMVRFIECNLEGL